MAWEAGPGVVLLPDGARIRGRGLLATPPVPYSADRTVFLLGHPPPETTWPSSWLPWPDFRLPRDRASARVVFQDVHDRALAGCRVELVCEGGRGRTGTAIACIAQLAGVRPEDAVRWTRAHYHPRAVETLWQRRYVERFGLHGR